MRYFLFCLLFSSLYCCTDFVVATQNGCLINGRSLEFAKELTSEIQFFPRKVPFSTKAPSGAESFSWTSKWAFLGVVANDMGFAFDGMNEQGLSFGYLWLPHYTNYPKVPRDKMDRAIDFVDLGMWILGNFQTVEELKSALKEVYVWGHPVKGLGEAPIHVAVHDARGNNLVIEFVKEGMQVYDNPLSVLTNSPPFDWQTENIQNYLNLTSQNPAPISFRKMKWVPQGQGYGLTGLPGDFSPPSRFVKIATFLRLVDPVLSCSDGVNLAEHLLNSVDIPLGVAKEGRGSDHTQWIVMKDLNHKVFYFRSYKDLSVKKIEMKKLNMNGQKKSLPVDLQEGYIDVTDRLSS